MKTVLVRIRINFKYLVQLSNAGLRCRGYYKRLKEWCIAALKRRLKRPVLKQIVIDASFSQERLDNARQLFILVDSQRDHIMPLIS